MNENARKSHWSWSVDEEQIGWLTLDKQGASTNVLSAEVVADLHESLNEIETTSPRALVVMSGKRNGFIAGADIKEFTSLEGPEEAFDLVRKAQHVMDQLEALPFPTIALINGFALGGGLELALACRHRIAIDDPKCVMGLPEVKLGIHPGFGGTVRSVAIVGVLAAMDMMLTGRNIRPKQALRMGLVDQVVPARHLERAGRMMALSPPAPGKPSIKQRALALGPVRSLTSRLLEKQVAKKARRDHYPAPYAIIDLWRRHGDDPAGMYVAEARSIAQLMCSRTSRSLVRVFLLQDKMKSLAAGKKYDFRHVHVVGAGVMGGDIAAWCALRGLDVTLEDRAPEYIGPAIARAHKLFKRKLREPRLIQAAMDRLMPDVGGTGVPKADVVIEAIFENKEAKQELYQRLEPVMKPDAVLATNTSSIRLEDLWGGLKAPHRLIGLHFFNPVAMMPLVEVIRTAETTDEEIDRGIAFARRIDRLPLPCLSSPGFVVNRVLMPYMMEALVVAQEGVPLPVIDRAARDFGMPMGPVELADTVGLDVVYHVARILGEAYEFPMPEELERMVESKKLGRKTGEGFYVWKDGKPVKGKSDQPVPPGLSDRLMLPMINQAIAVYRDHVVEDLDLLDGGVIFGTGFAPFRGGPIHYARQRGVEEVRRSLLELENRYGERFRPDEGWEQIA